MIQASEWLPLHQVSATQIHRRADLRGPASVRHDRFDKVDRLAEGTATSAFALDARAFEQIFQAPRSPPPAGD